MSFSQDIRVLFTYSTTHYSLFFVEKREWWRYLTNNFAAQKLGNKNRNQGKRHMLASSKKTKDKIWSAILHYKPIRARNRLWAIKWVMISQ